MNQAFSYCLKIWLLCILLAPLALMLYGKIYYGVSDWGIYFGIVVLSGILSLPSFFGLGWLAYFAAKKCNSAIMAKLSLSIASLPMTLFPFYFVGNFKFGLTDYDVTLPYLITILAGIWLFELQLYNDRRASRN